MMPTMTLQKVPWRKFPRLEKGVVICTRLISSVSIGAGKIHDKEHISIKNENEQGCAIPLI